LTTLLNAANQYRIAEHEEEWCPPAVNAVINYRGTDPEINTFLNSLNENQVLYVL
jgi:hypothetical protein